MFLLHFWLFIGLLNVTPFRQWNANWSEINSSQLQLSVGGAGGLFVNSWRVCGQLGDASFANGVTAKCCHCFFLLFAFHPEWQITRAKPLRGPRPRSLSFHRHCHSIHIRLSSVRVPTVSLHRFLLWARSLIFYYRLFFMSPDFYVCKSFPRGWKRFMPVKLTVREMKPLPVWSQPEGTGACWSVEQREVKNKKECISLPPFFHFPPPEACKRHFCSPRQRHKV